MPHHSRAIIDFGTSRSDRWQPARVSGTRRQRCTGAVQLTRAVKNMAVVPVDEGGHSLVERDGWSDAQIAEPRRRLDRSDREPATWAGTYDFNRRSAQEQADEDQSS